MRAAIINRLDGLGARGDRVLALGLGALTALAMAPLHLVFVPFMTFPLLLRLLDKALTTARAFWTAWLFAFGFYLSGLYWVAAALLVDVRHNWWALPFAAAGLPALMAFYPAALTAVWQRLAWRGTARVLGFCAFWGLAEWVRGWAFTGFPWNLWGHVWGGFAPLFQSAALFGLYGLSLLTLLWCMLPVLWGLRAQREARITFAVLLALAVLLGVWGQGRLHKPLALTQTQLRIVQPNIAQTAKWDPAAKLAHEESLWALTAQRYDAAPDIIVWPETALTLADTMDVRQLAFNLGERLPPHAVLAAGLLDVGFDDAARTPQFYNRLAFYNAQGQKLGAYDKSHLVPFGEFLPFQHYWPVRPVAFQAGQFSAGSGVQTAHIAGLPPLSPLICYEVLFPGASALRSDRPQWILNVTNDAWYGRTSGPYQHLEIARARAIEEGLPVVRAANTGISAVIDARGTVLSALALGTSGVIDHALPRALHPTWFARFGNALFFVLLAVVFGAAFVLQARYRAAAPQIA